MKLLDSESSFTTSKLLRNVVKLQTSTTVTSYCPTLDITLFVFASLSRLVSSSHLISFHLLSSPFSSHRLSFLLTSLISLLLSPLIASPLLFPLLSHLSPLLSTPLSSPFSSPLSSHLLSPLISSHNMGHK